MLLRRFLFLLCACFALGPPIVAQNIVSGTITGSTCVGIDVTAGGVVGVSVTGTWSGTIQPQVAMGGDPAQNTKVTLNGTSQTTITANNFYQSLSVSGASLFQLCGNTVTNTASIKLKVNPQSASAGSGNAGTVTSVSGTVNQIDSTGGAAPVLSLDAAIQLPGSMTAGTGASITFSGTGTNNANQVNGAVVPASANGVATNASRQFIASTAHNVAFLLTCAAASASGTAYTCTTAPAFTPSDGDVILFQADVTSGASPTLVVNAQTGTPALQKNLNGALVAAVANDVVAGGDYLAEFDGANWQIQGNLGTALYQGSAAGTFPTLNQNTSGTSGGLTGTPNISVGTIATSSSANVANLNAATLNGNTFAAPGTIGGTTPGVVFASNTITPYALDTGAAQAIAITVTGLPTSIQAGLCVTFKTANASGGATTLNVTPSGQSAYGAIALDKRTTAGVAAIAATGDITSGGIYRACYDGAVWVLEATSGTVMSAGSLTAHGPITGNSNNQVSGTSNVTYDATNAFYNKYNSETLAGFGVPYVRGVTSQKAETTTADANVLTVTPAATVGTYRTCVVISVSSATSGVIAWTQSWVDSNGTTQTNVAQSLFQMGTAAPNTTFTTSAAGNYYGCTTFDVNNAATAIVVKWVGGGTTAAKMSATIERLQ